MTLGVAIIFRRLNSSISTTVKIAPYMMKSISVVTITRMRIERQLNSGQMAMPKKLWNG